MKRRSILIALLGVAGLTMLLAVIVQRHELLGLRGKQQRLVARSPGASDLPAQAVSIKTAAKSLPVAGITASPELLRLRNQVNLVTLRKQELAGLRAENEILRLRFSERSTNAILGLPPDYIRKSQARLAGFNTPEHTLQSFLWALQNRDATNALLALTPETAAWFQAEAQLSGSFEKLFDRSDALIGFSIVSTQRIDDETLQADIQLVPGLPSIGVNLQKVGNEWKMTSPLVP